MNKILCYQEEQLMLIMTLMRTSVPTMKRTTIWNLIRMVAKGNCLVLVLSAAEPEAEEHVVLEASDEVDSDVGAPTDEVHTEEVVLVDKADSGVEAEAEDLLLFNMKKKWSKKPMKEFEIRC